MKSEDIARLAGVSRGTVSRVINGKPDVSEKTRQKIQQIIKEHNYVPDQSARKLVGKTPQVLGLFIRNRMPLYKDNLIPWSSHEIPYFGSLILSVISEAKVHGYTVMVSIINSHKDKEDMISLFRSGTIAGGVLLGFSENVLQVEHIIQEGFPVALIDQKREDEHPNVILSNVDDFTGGYMATKYLIDNGHVNIAHVCGNLHIVSAQLRKEGYIQCLLDHNIAVCDEWIVEGEYDEHMSYEVSKELFICSQQKNTPPPTAIFFANDIMAVGGCRSFSELGLRVPQDISFIGYDGYPLDWVMGKTFSSVKSSLDKLGAFGVRGLVEYIQNRISSPAHKEQPELILGASVKNLSL